jgi:hypothetical protein
MPAILIGLVLGVFIGAAYLFSKEPGVRRTLGSSILLGVAIGLLVELAHRPLFTAIFVGLSIVFLREFILWVLKSYRKP